MQDSNRRPSLNVMTLHRVPNYGSVLQTYATQQFFRSLGYEVSIVDYFRPDQVQGSHDMGSFSEHAGGIVPKRLYSAIRAQYMRQSNERFSGFVRDGLSLTRPFFSYESLVSDPPVADVNVVGSDQVWNMRSTPGGIEPFLLNYLPDGSLKMSLSSSIGIGDLLESELEVLEPSLRNFRWLSVRERSAREQLATRGLSADVICDPVLLVDDVTWSDLAGQSAVDSPYILKYGLNNRRSLGATWHLMAQERALREISLSPHWWAPWRRPNDFRLPPVSEFLSLFQNATHIVTDSFHGTLFALMFQVPFTVVLPSRFSVRLTDLLEDVHASGVVVDPSQRSRHDAEVDWRTIYSELSALRLASRTRVSRAFASLA